jgi:hypothetical protein
MKSFKEILLETESKQRTLGDVLRVGTNMEDADFWITRRGTIDTVGHPSKEFNKEHFGVKITNPEILDPRYAYYMMQHIANTGHYRQHATGSTSLVNIKASHITSLPI